MDPSDWTPARGWAIAMGRAAYRSVVAGAVIAVVAYFAWPMDRFLPGHWSFMVLLLFVSIAVGYPAGHAVGRKLVEDSGLAGRTICLPVLLILFVLELAALMVVEALRGGWGMLVFVATCGMVFWSLAACAKTVLLE